MDVFEVLEDLDAPALVGVLGLYEPYVLVAVLHRRALLPGVALGNLLEAIDERIQARIRQAQVHKIGGRRRIKDGVVGCSGLLVMLVVVLEGADEAALRADVPEHLEVVEHEQIVNAFVPCIDLAVAARAEVHWPEEEVGLVDGVLRAHLCPILPLSEDCSKRFRIVADHHAELVGAVAAILWFDLDDFGNLLLLIIRCGIFCTLALCSFWCSFFVSIIL